LLDGALRRRIDPLLDRAGGALARRGVAADWVTLAGFAAGLAAAATIWLAWPAPATLLLFAASRIADGLDGAVARASRPSDFGGFLDILCDFAFYGAIPLAFALRDPGANALAAAALLFSFYVNGTSFLAFAAIAAKRGEDEKPRGPKSLVFSAGLMEAAETFAVFVAMILRPDWFPALALGFAALCLVTAGLRAAMAARRFR
jgi:phosphatidylglycerophosphate synthase